MGALATTTEYAILLVGRGIEYNGQPVDKIQVNQDDHTMTLKNGSSVLYRTSFTVSGPFITSNAIPVLNAGNKFSFNESSNSFTVLSGTAVVNQFIATTQSIIP